VGSHTPSDVPYTGHVAAKTETPPSGDSVPELRGLV